MTGNVWEWCENGDDGYEREPISRGFRGTPESSPQRVYRAGGFGNNAKGSRATFRNARQPATKKDSIGIRPAMLITKP
ncbi:MAG: sulfatase activating formylglycine-generating enzyme [Planctomycetota bacterium]|jgi:formylglycine-generating enzyme required for sulfatase activity